MELSRAAPASTLASDLDAAWSEIDHATVDGPTRATNWNKWSAYCVANNLGSDPYLSTQSPSARFNALVGFAARVRTGSLGRGKQVKADTVATALRHVSQIIMLAGYPDPRKQPGSPDLHLALDRLLKSYRNNDDAPRSQLALPVTIFENIAATEGHSSNPLEQATADIIILSFFFLLRIGETTIPATNRPTRTTQFRRRDVTFWKLHNNQRRKLSPNAPLPDLLAADAVTLKLDNQKNSVRNATLDHERVPGGFSPTEAAARLYHNSRRAYPHSEDALLCGFAPTKAVTAQHVHQVLQRAAVRLLLWEQGYDLDRIGTHSIRASGAMALHLNGVTPETIMLMGRWRSQTWLTYIHTQIAAFSAGMSRLMARPILFYNAA